MPRARGTVSIAVSIALSTSLLATPSWGSSDLGLGTVVFAQRAHIDAAQTSVGATVFAGDRVDTEPGGSLQIRSGVTRLVLSGSSRLVWGPNGDSPSATLTGGTAAFSTAGARALVLHASTAAFKPQSDEPTVANVTLLNAKELLVRCSRGAVLIAVEDDVRVIPEGAAYRIVLDPDLAPRAEAPAPSTPASWGQNPPTKAGRSRFLWYAIAFTAIITGFVVWKAFESPEDP
jgi:hypothetical protein